MEEGDRLVEFLSASQYSFKIRAPTVSYRHSLSNLSHIAAAQNPHPTHTFTTTRSRRPFFYGLHHGLQHASHLLYGFPCFQMRFGGFDSPAGPRPSYHFAKAVDTSSPSILIWFHIPQ